jgi:adenylate cyclase
LRHVLSCTKQLLGRIDRLAELGLAEGRPTIEQIDTSFAAVAEFLRSATPLQDIVGSPRRLLGRILVVDDEPSNRDLLSRRLAREGHTVAVAQDGACALAMAAEADFDLILLDIMMPGISGFQVLKELKSSESKRHIPVIVISALDQIDSVVTCIEAGAEDYLPKTFNPTLLRARISAPWRRRPSATGTQSSLANCGRRSRDRSHCF